MDAKNSEIVGRMPRKAESSRMIIQSEEKKTKEQNKLSRNGIIYANVVIRFTYITLCE